MFNKRWTVCAAAALLFSGTAAAQQPGTLLLGGFGQYTIFDNKLPIDNGFGYGGRIGAFFSPTWSLEAEASYTNGKRTAGVAGPASNANIKYGPVSARLAYNLPLGSMMGLSRSAIIIGAGGVISPYHNDVAGVGNYYGYKYGVSGDLGLRIGLGSMFALRGDAIADYMPTSQSQKNFRFQAGLELLPDFSSMMGMNSTAPANFAWFDTQPAPLPGTVELKGFGQYMFYDNKLNLKNTFGYGGGIGVFLTPNIEVEGDGSYTNPNTKAAVGAVPSGTAYDNGQFSLRGVYNLPFNLFGRTHQFLLGAGGTRLSYHRSNATTGTPDFQNTYGFGPEGIVGLRLGIANRTALRVDGIANYLTNLKTTNYGVRAGLSVMVGGASRAVVDTTPPPPPPPPAPAPEPAPAPAPPPPPPPAPVVDTTQITAPIYFDFDKSDIRTDAAATLDAKIPYLQANPGMRIRIEGNTDERGSDEYNLALGQRRAAAAKQYLVGKGIDAGRIDIVSYGEERPVCTERGEPCWQQNRRDDFRILVIGSDAIKAPGSTTP